MPRKSTKTSPQKLQIKQEKLEPVEIKIEQEELSEHPTFAHDYIKMEPEEHFTLEITDDSATQSDEINKVKPINFVKKVRTVRAKNGKKRSYFQCTICGNVLSYSATDHMKRVHPEVFKDSLLNCHLCDKLFQQKKNLETHMRTKHPDGKRQQFRCDICWKTLKGKLNLRSHMKSHLPSVKCDICQLEVAALCLKYHKERIHSAIKKYQCNFCPKRYGSKSVLKTHEKTHTRVLNCEFCEKEFSTSSRLKRHVKAIHENPLSFSCDKCDKKFSRKDNLKAHQKQHDPARPKPFKCEKCDYATDDKRCFNDHLLSHIKEEERIKAMKDPVKCQKCGKLYRDEKTLITHKRDVHMIKTYTCDICGNLLRGMRSITKHVEWHVKSKIQRAAFEESKLKNKITL